MRNCRPVWRAHAATHSNVCWRRPQSKSRKTRLVRSRSISSGHRSTRQSAATARTKVYWGHEGCSFTEQISNFGLPLASHWGWLDGYQRRRDPDFEFGVQANGACRYEFVHQLDFSFMILEYFRY